MKQYLFFVLLSLVMLAGLALYQLSTFSDGKLHIIICNVGQGDGIIIRTPTGIDMVLDGGPDQAIASCLAGHTPFWDREIEVMLLSHPHADHYTGLTHLLHRHTLGTFITEKLFNTTAGFKALDAALAKTGKTPRYMYQGDGFHTNDGIRVTFLGPTASYIQKTSPHEIVGESGEFASLISVVSYGNFHMLFTGDSQVEGLEEALSNLSTPVTVLQVPHHGSRYGLDSKVIEEINPSLAVISVGKNSYGHPAPSILGLLSTHQIPYLRTDKHGDIEIVTDGKTWEVKR